MTAIDRVLAGTIDLHCHSGPSPFPRRIDHVEALRQAQDAGMRAIVVKSHHHNTVMDLLAMAPRLEGMTADVFGGIALNNQVGGINPHAVDLSLKLGGRIVWFPTISSGRHIEHHAAHPNLKFPKSSVELMATDALDIFGEDGDLRPEVHSIINQIKEADAVLAGGHMDPERITALMEAAKTAGLKRLLINHPDFVVEADTKQVQRFVELGAVIEHSLCMYDEESSFYHWDVGSLVDRIELVGPENTSLGSDLGQVGNPLPVDSYRKICGQLLDSGFDEKQVRMMTHDNPARLLGIDD
ncbi:MAG: hypothetical protein GEU79_03490 [Acidimicrobiia bacterium]|nr:hypothetical protein [Acidimicrobiia bacterium]